MDIVDEEPPFLQGHGRHWVDLSPVKIVKVICLSAALTSVMSVMQR